MCLQEPRYDLLCKSRPPIWATSWVQNHINKCLLVLTKHSIVTMQSIQYIAASVTTTSKMYTLPKSYITEEQIKTLYNCFSLALHSFPDHSTFLQASSEMCWAGPSRVHALVHMSTSIQLLLHNKYTHKKSFSWICHGSLTSSFVNVLYHLQY